MKDIFVKLSNLSGPVVFSISGFLASVLVQRSCSPSEFGVFAFVQVVLATGMALSNGLITVPAASRVAIGDSFPKIISIFLPVSLGLSALGSIAVVPIIYGSGATYIQLLIALALSAVTWSRYSIRAISLIVMNANVARNSDICYGVAFIVASVVIHFNNYPSVNAFLIAQLLASILSFFYIYINSDFSFVINASAVNIYISSFKSSGIGSLVSSACGQISSSSHAYITTLFLSPTAFAPIAIATLVYRPLGVVLTGVMQFETPRIARSLRKSGGEYDKSDIIIILRELFWIMIIAWLLNVIISFFIAFYADELFSKIGYDIYQIKVAISLMAALVLLRALREPHTAMLSVSGANMKLAKVSAFCATLTLSIVIISIVIFRSSPSLAICGPVIGELVNLIMILRLSKRSMKC